MQAIFAKLNESNVQTTTKKIVGTVRKADAPEEEEIGDIPAED